ncbi:hypothetical protein [Sphingomonas sp. Root1294]|nr:hypothetical protein [Sphingomonas sp. Root1294]
MTDHVIASIGSIDASRDPIIGIFRRDSLGGDEHSIGRHGIAFPCWS